MFKQASFIILLGLSSSVYSASKPYSFNLNTGVLYDDNVSRAILSEDIESDTILNLGLSASYSLHQDEHSLFRFSAGIDGYQYQDFDRLSNMILNTRVDYEIQPGHGYTAAWYLISLEYSFANYQSRLRDSDGFSLEVASGKRFTDRISLRAGLVFESFEADADEFDQDNTRLYLSTDYSLNDDNILYFTLAYTNGDTATSTRDLTAAAKTLPVQRYGHHLPNEISLTPLRSDDAFQNGFVYKLDTTAISLQIGDNIALSSHQSIDASVFYYNTDSDGADSYDGMIFQLSYLHRFE